MTPKYITLACPRNKHSNIQIRFGPINFMIRFDSLIIILIFLDINECDGNHSCPQESSCQNIYGSFRCNCPAKKASYNGMCVGKHLDTFFWSGTSHTMPHDSKGSHRSISE